MTLIAFADTYPQFLQDLYILICLKKIRDITETNIDPFQVSEFDTRVYLAFKWNKYWPSLHLSVLKLSFYEAYTFRFGWKKIKVITKTNIKLFWVLKFNTRAFFCVKKKIKIIFNPVFWSATSIFDEVYTF